MVIFSLMQKIEDIQKASHIGVIKVGDNAEIPCVVLDDGNRIITQKGILNHLGRRSNGVNSKVAEKSRELNIPSFAVAENIQPYLCTDFSEIAQVIQFRMANNVISYGYNPEVLVELCNAYVEAMTEEKLEPQQKHIAVQCSRFLRTLTKVGINSLIDEATGYEKHRPEGELAKFFDYFLNREAEEWEKLFDKEYYQHIYRLWGFEKDPETVRNHPQCVGNITNKLIYNEMPEELRNKLEELNPVQENGQRRYRHHQFLKDKDHGGIGREWLDERKQKVITLMRVSNDKKEFMDFLKKANNGE